MEILCDTRQKKGKHLNIERYCSEHNITMIPYCLSVGDYMLKGGNIAVDTKQSIVETANDLYADKKSFNKKYKKCYKQNIKLYVLIEEKVKDLRCWTSKVTKISGRFLLELMHDLEISYGVCFVFCDKQDTGKILIDLLKGSDKNG